MRTLLGRWVAWTVAGEVAGFVAPAIVGVASARWSPWASVPALVAAGAVEGLVLGSAQAHVLARELPPLDSRRFAVLTALAAALAYLVAMVPVSLATSLEDAPRGVVVLGLALASFLLLTSLGTAQWLELRHHVDGAWTWVPVTAGAWLLGLTAFMVIATPLWHEGQAVALAVTIGLVAAVAMAGCVALVTGLALTRLLRRRRPDLR